MSDAEAGRAGVISDAAPDAVREPESSRASAPATRDVQVAAESESATPARVADAPRHDAESQVLVDGDGDGARVLLPEREARRSVPETGETATPYAQPATPNTQAATPTAQAASPQPVQVENAVASEDAAATEERRGRVARVREETRARVENTRARVERVKGDALVALEDTPDDSGLRFVAVAVILFVLFLLFLFLSVTILR